MKFLASLIATIVLAIGPCAPAPVMASGGAALEQPLIPCLINSSLPTVCKGSPGVMLGWVNNDLLAQSVTVTCYAYQSNLPANSTIAGFSSTGLTVIATEGQLGIGQVVPYPGGGKSFSLGMVCVPSGAPATAGPGTGIEVYVY